MGRNKGNTKMKGISIAKAQENAIKYRTMFDKWSKDEVTLEELGNEYGVTKQRMWQIITRCKLGQGDYYYGVQLARHKWTELRSLYHDVEQTQLAFNAWLEDRKIKLASDNQKVAPHTGWDW